MGTQTLQLAQIIIGSLISIGILIAGFGYFYAQFFKGKNSKSREEFDLFTSQLDALQKLCKEQAEQIKTLQEDSKKHTGEIGRLNGIVESKDKTIAELNAIIQNRDPNLMKSLERIGERLESIEKKLA